MSLTLITGANRGIGLALAKEASTRGHEVLGTYRGLAPAEPKLRWHPLDVTDPESTQYLADALQGQAVSLLVCNAGVFPKDPDSLDDWKDGFGVNVTGVYLTVKALMPALKLAIGGKIAIIASQMGSSTRAPGGSLIYRASKAAAINLGRNLATDLRAHDIAVGIFHPGWVQTDMGGLTAEITPQASAKGLMNRFERLSLDKTGVWEDWQGNSLPY